jgi:hypothetical protein
MQEQVVTDEAGIKFIFVGGKCVRSIWPDGSVVVSRLIKNIIGHRQRILTTKSSQVSKSNKGAQDCRKLSLEQLILRLTALLPTLDEKQRVYCQTKMDVALRMNMSTCGRKTRLRLLLEELDANKINLTASS